MSNWVSKGLRTPVRTTRYPATRDDTPGTSPGLPAGGAVDPTTGADLVARCPTGALTVANGRIAVNPARCVHCYRCVRGVDRPIDWNAGYEWAAATAADGGPGAALGRAFHGSAHILVVDAGDCGACLSEVKQLNNPYYNMHRLGLFITPTPRNADILIVVGPGTANMRWALRKAYDAMPTPKRVIAVGACALSGGVFSPSFASGAGIHDILPVDVAVPGSPPPPLAILHGLLVVTGRAASAAWPRPASDDGGTR